MTSCDLLAVLREAREFIQAQRPRGKRGCSGLVQRIDSAIHAYFDRRKSGEGGEDAERLSARITEYLSAGGLWNPESMEHDKVRRLLIDCRTEFDAAIADSAIKSAIAQVDAARTEGKRNG